MYQNYYIHKSLNFLHVNSHYRIAHKICQRFLSPLSCFVSPPVEGGEIQSLAPAHGNKTNHRPL